MSSRKYELSSEVKKLFDEARKEPYHSINRGRVTSIEYFEYLIGELGPFLQRFEEEVGLNSTSEWRGKRLHECRPEKPLSKTASSHLVGHYFAHLDENEDAAIIPLENYGAYEEEDGSLHYHTYTMPHLAIIRPVHIDAKKHIKELQLHELEIGARESSDRIKEQFPEFESLNTIYDYINKSYTAFPDILHSLAVIYFEIEGYNSDSSPMVAFDTVIELPPNQLVIDALKEVGCPIGYKLNEDEQVNERESFIRKNLAVLNLDQMSRECLASVKRYVKSMNTIREILSSLSRMDFDAYEESMNEFLESQKFAGFFSAFDFLEKEKEHIVRRHRI